MSDSKQKRACEQAVKQVREILARRESDLVDAFQILRKVEVDGSWRFAAGGESGFDAFLQANFPGKVPPSLYHKAISAIDLYGEALIRKIGVYASTHLMAEKLVKNARVRARVKKELLAFVKKHGVAPTAGAVRKVVLGISPSAVVPRRRKLSELIRENEQLRAENAVLRAENARLKAENEMLRLKPRGRRASGREQVAPS